MNQITLTSMFLFFLKQLLIKVTKIDEGQKRKRKKSILSFKGDNNWAGEERPFLKQPCNSNKCAGHPQQQ